MHGGNIWIDLFLFSLTELKVILFDIIYYLLI